MSAGLNFGLFDLRSHDICWCAPAPLYISCAPLVMMPNATLTPQQMSVIFANNVNVWKILCVFVFCFARGRNCLIGLTNWLVQLLESVFIGFACYRKKYYLCLNLMQFAVGFCTLVRF